MKCINCRYIRIYPEEHTSFGLYYCGHSGIEDSDPITIDEALQDNGFCEPGEVEEREVKAMVDRGQIVVATIHTGAEKYSQYIKVSIEDNLEQLANFMVSVIENKSVRIFDQYQEELLIEYQEGKFRFNENLKEVVEGIIAEMDFLFSNMKPRKVVKIHNYWMSDDNNSKVAAVKVIQAHGLKIDYSAWEDYES